MFTTQKIAAVSVINDLVTDSRVNRTCSVLHECGYEVLLIGRRLPESLPIPAHWPFKTQRMKLLINKGPLFYLFFNLRLFFVLLFKKTQLLYANDLDTLLPNFLVSKLKRIPLIYDSHELFCEVPELQHAPVKQKVWRLLEAWIVPKLKHGITVNESIASIFEKQYGVKFMVVRNIGHVPENFLPKTRSEVGLPLDKKILLLQGAGINVQRGAEELIEAMENVQHAVLYIIGGGDVWPWIKEEVKKKNLQEKVVLISKLPRQELWQYTVNADLGLSLDKDTNLNYHFSLPNKLFDYIHAGIPVLVSKLPELERIVTRYEIGEIIDKHEPTYMADKINELLAGKRLITYRDNTKRAAQELNWDNEKKPLKKVIGETQN